MNLLLEKYFAQNLTEYLENEITTQKKVTDELLSKLPFKAIVAGGAARDWFYGNPANDIDIYFKSDLSKENIIKTLEQLKILNYLSDVQIQSSNNLDPNYKNSSYLDAVFSFTLNSIKIQLMQINCNLDEVIHKFALSCSKIEYKQGNVFKPSVEFSRCNDLKIVLVNENYEENHPYVQKIYKRFKHKFKFYREM